MAVEPTEKKIKSHHTPANISPLRQVVWKITPLFAEWLSWPDNLFFAHGVLSQHSLVLELGCGISALAGLLLAPRITRYFLTDQPYVAKLVEQNIAENHQTQTHRGGGAPAKTARTSKRASPNPNPGAAARKDAAAGNVARAGVLHFTPLDWETDQVTPALAGSGAVKSFDVVLACDCIYNEALIEPFVSTCVDVCSLRAADASSSSSSSSSPNPCVCVVAQQLRDPLVFEAWLTRFAESFHTWRVPDELLHGGLRSNSGFVVHVGVLKDAINIEAL